MTFRYTQFATATLLVVASSPAWAEQGVKIWHPSAGAERVAIDAEGLTVNEADKIATFTGHVVIAQGETRLTCSRAVVWYRGTTSDSSAIDRIACEP